MTRRALRAATIALFATAAGVAAPSPAYGQGGTECDAGAPEVRALEFRGNASVPDDELEVSVRTTPSALVRRTLHIPLGQRRCLDRRVLASDIILLRAAYRSRGFYSAKIDTLVQPLRDNAVRVVFTIEEGLPIILASYTVEGLNGVLDSASIMQRRRLRVGQPFDFALYAADVDSIVRRLRNSGYYRADLIKGYDIRRDSLLAHVAITVVPGKRARFGSPLINVDPVEPDRPRQIGDETVKRVMGIREGDFYSDQAITEAQRNLFQLGTYRHIEIAPDSQSTSDSVVVLRVTLAEDFMRRLDSEYGWATLDCGKIRLQYTDLNAFRSARRMEVTAQASKLGLGEPLASPATRDFCTLGSEDLKDDSSSARFHYFGGISVRQPRLLGTRWVPTLSLYSERRGEFKAYVRTTNIGGDLSAVRDIGERTQLRLGYGVEWGKTEAPDAVLCALFSRCDEPSRANIGKLAPLGVASTSLSRIRTDNLVTPTRGYVVRGEFRTSASKLLFTDSSLFFNKATADFAWYTSFGWRNVLALRLRAGRVEGRTVEGTSNFIPPQERLYAGGPTSVRGFQPNELGDVVYIARAGDVDSTEVVLPGGGTAWRYSVPDTAGFERVVPLGGSSLVVGNLEYRIRDPFFFPDLVQYTLFLDAGDVWNKGVQPAIRWTPGVAVRLLSPVGPIQVNVGYNPYLRTKGPIYFENPTLSGALVSPLYCVTPRNEVNLVRNASGVLEPQPANQACLSEYEPEKRGISKPFLRRLTLTFSIGSDF